MQTSAATAPQPDEAEEAAALRARRSPLDDVLVAAGATMALRGRHRVAVDFGSVAGEEAVCRHGVGLVDRSDRVTYELRGDGEDLDTTTRALLGHEVPPGTAAHVADGWLCRVEAGRLLVRCEAHAAERCAASLRDATSDDVVVRDASDEHAGVGLVGPHAEEVLHALGLPERTGAARVGTAAVPAILLREDEHLFEVVEERGHAREVFDALREAGRRHGVSCVGCVAVERVHAAGTEPLRSPRPAAPARRCPGRESNPHALSGSGF